jgi:hypothetical protein
MVTESNKPEPSNSEGLNGLKLNNVFLGLAGMMIVLLIAITFLGAKQYFLFEHCREVVALSDKVLFGFTSIKEHVSETLLTGGRLDLQEVSSEIQGLDAQIKKIGDDFLIPEDLKAPFISNINPLGLVVSLRAVQGAESPTVTQRKELFVTLRTISEHLQQFNNALAVFTQSLLLRLHRVLVGTLALVVFVVCAMMFFMHKHIAGPIFSLHEAVCRLAGQNNKARRDGTIKASVTELSRHVLRAASEQKRLGNLVDCLGNVRDTIPDQMDNPDFWETLCLALQTNPDYLLVWVGLPTGDTLYPHPVSGCGCVSSAPQECRQTLKQLLLYCRQDGSLCATARKSVADKKKAVEVTAGFVLPDALHLSLPFADSRLYSASFPLMQDETLVAVVTMYSAIPESFSGTSLALLEYFFSQFDRLPVDSCAHSVEIYRYSVLGALASGFAHEITDSVNGALNYSQALLDIAGENLKDEEGLLLEKLFQEEVKCAELASELSRLAGSYDAMPEKMQITLLVERAVKLLTTQFKERGIRVEILGALRGGDVNVTVDSVLIILLTLLWRAAAYLEYNGVEKNERVITVTLENTEKNKTFSVTLDNSPQDFNITTVDPWGEPWPDFETCSRMLRQINGVIRYSTDNFHSDSPCCTLIFSLQ